MSVGTQWLPEEIAAVKAITSCSGEDDDIMEREVIMPVIFLLQDARGHAKQPVSYDCSLAYLTTKQKPEHFPDVTMTYRQIVKYVDHLRLHHKHRIAYQEIVYGVGGIEMAPARKRLRDIQIKWMLMCLIRNRELPILYTNDIWSPLCLSLRQGHDDFVRGFLQLPIPWRISCRDKGLDHPFVLACATIRYGFCDASIFRLLLERTDPGALNDIGLHSKGHILNMLLIGFVRKSEARFRRVTHADQCIHVATVVNMLINWAGIDGVSFAVHRPEFGVLSSVVADTQNTQKLLSDVYARLGEFRKATIAYRQDFFPVLSRVFYKTEMISDLVQMIGGYIVC
jgi:hypothetical protein